MISALPWFTAVVFALNAVNITRLPPASHDLKTTEERKVKVEGPGPMKNVGWLAASFCNGVLWTNQVILNLVIPLWLVQKTDAPWVVLAFLFGTNTVMCILLPLAAARGVRDLSTGLRAIRISTVFFIVSCVITLSTHHTLGLLTIVLFFLGHVDPHRRRAVPVRRQLDLRGRADGPAAPRRVPGRGRAHAAPWAVSGRRRSTRSS